MLSATVLCFEVFFFFNDPATTEIYTLSLHDALPIWDDLQVIAGRDHRARRVLERLRHVGNALGIARVQPVPALDAERSEEHTSELQSQSNLVCRLLLEKKNKNIKTLHTS